MIPFVKKGMSGLVFVPFCSILRRNSLLSYANSVDPDQTPRLAASDQGMHCLQIPSYGALEMIHYVLNAGIQRSLWQ